MIYTAKDGKRFNNNIQGRKYDESLGALHRNSLADLAGARGGLAHQDAVTQHGLARKVTIEREGNGRHRVTAVMADGHKHTDVHPEAFRAHDIARELLGIEAPPAIQTHGRARSQPTGPKEDERVRKEDNREEDQYAH